MEQQIFLFLLEPSSPPEPGELPFDGDATRVHERVATLLQLLATRRATLGDPTAIYWLTASQPCPHWMEACISPRPEPPRTGAILFLLKSQNTIPKVQGFPLGEIECVDRGTMELGKHS